VIESGYISRNPRSRVSLVREIAEIGIGIAEMGAGTGVRLPGLTLGDVSARRAEKNEIRRYQEQDME
jgi:hypothetical protein